MEWNYFPFDWARHLPPKRFLFFFFFSFFVLSVFSFVSECRRHLLLLFTTNNSSQLKSHFTHFCCIASAVRLFFFFFFLNKKFLMTIETIRTALSVDRQCSPYSIQIDRKNDKESKIENDYPATNWNYYWNWPFQWQVCACATSQRNTRASGWPKRRHAVGSICSTLPSRSWASRSPSGASVTGASANELFSWIGRTATARNDWNISLISVLFCDWPVRTGGTNCIRCFELRLRSLNVVQIHTEGLDKCYTTEEAAVATCPTEQSIIQGQSKEIMLYSK